MKDTLSILPDDNDAPGPRTRVFGARAEQAAVTFLQERGLRIVMTNFTTPLGRNRRGIVRTGEIDIIALDGNVLCFIEVKARRNVDFAPATANIDRRKQRQIVRTARAYRRIFKIRGLPYRYDAVTVIWPVHADPAIEYLKGYWDESIFRKKRWHAGATDSNF